MKREFKMKKAKKSLGKKEYQFSKSYYRRKRELIKRMFGGKTGRKNAFAMAKKAMIYYNIKMTEKVV